MGLKPYSQSKEDKIILNMFKSPGFFVDVGAADGVTFSNTLLLEERDWSGLNIEPDRASFDKLAKKRKTQCIFGAVGNSNGMCKFYEHAAGLISTVDLNKSIDFRKKDKRTCGISPEEYTCTDVPRYTLRFLLSEYEVPKKFEFLSIDVEGYEIPVLEGMDFNTFRPQVIAIEGSTKQDIANIKDFLLGCEYIYSFNLKQNLFFSSGKAIHKALSKSRRSINA